MTGTSCTTPQSVAMHTQVPSTLQKGCSGVVNCVIPAERGGWHTEVFDGKIGEESVEVGRTCRTNERGSTTNDGIYVHQERRKRTRGRPRMRWRDIASRET